MKTFACKKVHSLQLVAGYRGGNTSVLACLGMAWFLHVYRVENQWIMKGGLDIGNIQTDGTGRS